MDGVERVMVLGIFAVIVAILSIAAWGVTGDEDGLAADVAGGGMSAQADPPVITSDGSRTLRAPGDVALASDGKPSLVDRDSGTGLDRRAGRGGRAAGRPDPLDPLAGAGGSVRQDFVSLSSVQPATPPVGRRPVLVDPPAADPAAGLLGAPGAVPESEGQVPAFVEYTVVKGDTLWGIVRRHFGEGDTKGQIQLVQQLNPGLDVARISEGARLKLPTDLPQAVVSTPVTQRAKPGTTLYTILSGDSLRKIASAKLGAEKRWQEIWELNRDTIADPEKIHAGMTILLPAK